MEIIWQLRAFRLWVVLYVPAAMFFGYHALSSAVEIAEGRREFASWVKVEQEKVAKGERAPIEPVDLRFAMLGRDFDRLYEHRNVALLFLIGGLAIPALAGVVMRAISWIWVNESRPTSPPFGPPGPELASLKRYMRWYWWSWAFAAVLVMGLLFSPENSIKTAISAIVQGLGLVVLVWVFMRLKVWWQWRQK